MSSLIPKDYIMASIRKPVVGYCNGRLISMFEHEDCTELKTRSDFAGRTFEHSAVVYQSGDGWFVMTNTNVAGTLEKVGTDLDAYASFDKALRGAFHAIANVQGWRD